MSDKYISKEEFKRRKKINKSLVFAGDSQRADLGIISFNSDDKIVCNKNNCFIQVYKLSCNSLIIINKVISLLCSNLEQRFRISTFVQETMSKNKYMLFLSVFYDCDEYFYIHDLVRVQNENIFQPFSSLSKLNVDFELLSLEQVIMYWNAYLSSGFSSDTNVHDVLCGSGSRSVLVFPEYEYIDRKISKVGGIYFTSLRLISNKNETNHYPFEMFGLFDKVYTSLDIQRISEEEMSIYNKMLDSLFHPSSDLEYDDEKTDYVNYSVSTVFFGDDPEKLENNTIEFIKKSIEYGYNISFCPTNEKDCLNSLCSFGINDFVNMRIMKLKNIIKFYSEV